MNQLLPTGVFITLVHLSFGDPERIACMPKMTEFGQTVHHPNYVRSNDPRAVSCPQCKKSEVYVEAMKKYA